MKRIPNISLTQQELEQIKKQPYFDFGGEATIYTTPNPHTLYKIFDSQRGMSTNKLRKLEILYQKSPDNCVQPLSTISCDGRLIGYEMTYDERDKEFRYVMGRMSSDEKLYWLKHTRDILEQLKRQGIIHGDVASRNILVNPLTKEAKFCDIDNVSIGQYPIDITSHTVKPYKRIYGVDEGIDIYGHNIMTLDAFFIDPCGTTKPTKKLKLSGMRTYYGTKYPEYFDSKYIVQYVKKK